MRAKEKERATVDSKELDEHSLVNNKHTILNGGQKKILLGGPKEKGKKGFSNCNEGFQKPEKGTSKDFIQHTGRGRGPKRKGQGRRLSSSWIVVYLFLPSSSDDHHPLHSCLGTGERVGTQNRVCLHIVHLLAHPVSSIANCCCWFFGGSSITTLPLLVMSIRTFATLTGIVQCVWVNTLR